MSSIPLVSVIIPACNAETFIQYTLESILAQTYQEFEVIVVDDGSHDRTVEIVESFIDRDARIQLLSQSNLGVSAARNRAMQHAKGKYIAPIDADDFWLPEKLEKQVKCLEDSDHSVGLVYSWSIYVDRTGEIIGYSPFGTFGKVEGNVFTFLVFYNFLDNGSTMMFRRSCLDRIGGFNCELKACEDWEFYLRLAEHYEFRIVPEYLIAYRQYIGSSSSKCAAMAAFYESIMADIYQCHPELPRYIRRWANTLFYNNLLGKSYVAKDYKAVFVWLYRVLSGDLALLLRPGIYKVIPVASFNLLLQPLRSSIRQLKHRFLKSSLGDLLKQISAKNTAIKIDSLKPRLVPSADSSKTKRSISEPIFWKPYDLVMLKRWQYLIKTTKPDPEN